MRTNLTIFSCDFPCVRDLITAYRACTSQSEERALVKEEAAHIRDLFREGDKHFRRQNVSKLLFFHMNGYPTDFGITECINLCASTKFADKRVAYLGLTILVNETESIIMLMTNLLKQDLSNPDIEIVSLALNVLGDISNGEMLRELMPEIEMHLRSPNPLIRKRAGIVAVRAVRKLPPDDTINILNLTPNFFDIRSSAVHVAGTSLVSALCAQHETHIATLQLSTLPVLLSILEEHALGRPPQRTADLYGSAHEAENPFVVTKLISTVRILLSHTSIENNVLKHVARTVSAVINRFDSSKIICCAVLYECVRITTALRSQPEMRDMALLILAKFLDHKEATVRYIALKELTELADAEGTDVFSGISGLEQKLLAGLKEADPTVRVQAVELIFRATNTDNVEQMLNELAEYVRRSNKDDQEAIKDACEKMFLLADELIGKDERKVDLFVTTLILGHRYISDDVITCLFAFISSRPNVRSHAVRILYDRVIRPATLKYQNKIKHTVSSLSGGDIETDANVERRPRCEAVALQVIAEYADVALQTNISLAELIQSFEYFTVVVDESQDVNGGPVAVSDENSQREFAVVGEVALSGLFKIAARVSDGSKKSSVRTTGDHDYNIENVLGVFDRNLRSPQLPAGPSIPRLPAPPTSEEDFLALVPLGENVTNNTVTVYDAGMHELTDLDFLSSSTAKANESKLSADADVVALIRKILAKFVSNTNLEQQQRACEYIALLDAGAGVTAQIAKPMPPMSYSGVRAVLGREHSNAVQPHRDLVVAGGSANLLVDIMDDFDAASSSADVMTQATQAKSGVEFSNFSDHEDPLAALKALSLTDDLSSITGANEVLAITLGEEATSSSGCSQSEFKRSTVPFHAGSTNNSGILHNFKTDTDSSIPSGKADTVTKNLLDTDEIRIDITLARNGNDRSEIMGNIVMSNMSSRSISNYVLQLAVPRYISLTMKPASSSEAGPKEKISQTVHLKNTAHGIKPIQLRYRVEFLLDNKNQSSRYEGVVSDLFCE